MHKLVLIFFLLFPSVCLGATRYVSTTGTDTGVCTNSGSPCRTIVYGVSQLASGDTLIIANGTYPEASAVRNVPSGSNGPDGIVGTADDIYTTVRAENDWGVLVDGSGWAANSWIYGMRLENLHHIKVQGIRFHADQQPTGGPMMILSSHHIKIIRCGFAGGGVTSNAAGADIGPDVDYLLLEECYSYGGGRYQFIVYWSDHVVMRRNVARNDYYHFDLQSAAFVNYDSVRTVWQNNIAIDSNDSCCTSPGLHLYAAFFNENKTDHAADTSQEFHGNIVLNYQTYYAAHLDWLVSGTRRLSNNIWWDSIGGYWGDQGSGTTASWTQFTNTTVGRTHGTYDGPNDGAARGTGISIYRNLSNSITDSILVSNNSYGLADYASGDYNALYGNGANYGGTHTPTAGAHNVTTHNILYNASTNPTGSLKYLPRGPESGSTLATAGSSGGRIGARVMWKIGGDGTLWGEPGWNTERSPENGYGGEADKLWPFPNEAIIKSSMASYSGPGLSGTRGFATLTGKQLNGVNNVTLTSYIWEYLGNQMPSDIYNTGPDTTPSPFSFSDNTGVAPSTVIYSTSVKVLAIDSSTTISLSGTGCEYRINTGSWATTNGNVDLNDNVALRVTSSGAYSTAKSCILTMGGVADTWTVTTLAAARTPLAPTIRGVSP